MNARKGTAMRLSPDPVVSVFPDAVVDAPQERRRAIGLSCRPASTEPPTLSAFRTVGVSASWSKNGR